MHWLDSTLLAILALGAAFGFMTGLLWQIARVASLALGLWACLLFHDQAAELIREYLLQGADENLISGLAYTAVFLVVYFVLLLVTGVMKKLVVASGFAWLDRFLGAALGTAKSAAILGAACLLVGRLTNPTARNWMERCSVAPALSRGMENALAMIPDDTKRNFSDSLTTLRSKIEETQ